MATKQTNWRLEEDVIEWVKEQAEKEDRAPGYWLSKLLQGKHMVSTPALKVVEAKERATRFKAPELSEVIEYFVERGQVNAVDSSERFIDHYQSNGWKVGKNSMKDWKAAVRTWVKRGSNNADHKPGTNAGAGGKQGVVSRIEQQARAVIEGCQAEEAGQRYVDTYDPAVSPQMDFGRR